MYLYIMNGRQNFLLLQKNMAKVGGPQCAQLSTFHVHFLLLLSSDNFVSYKSVHIYSYI